MYRRRNFNVLMIAIATLSLVIIVSLVYAGFTGQLNITGTAVGRDSAWDIHFENVSTITTTGTAKVLSNHQPVINSNNPTQIQDYEVSLTSPTDSISFTFDVVNDGNYNAKITSVSVGTPQCTSTDTTSAVNMCNNLTYTLKYSSGATIQTNDVVYAKDKVTMKVTLTFNDINDASLLPTAGVSISNLGIQINFEQEGNALVNETTGEVANYKVYHVGDKVSVNNEDYWVIENSGAGDDYVVALKDTPLTQLESNTYGATIPINANTNGGMSYGSTSDYATSYAKIVVETWSLDNLQQNQLKDVNNYRVRLITKDEYDQIPISYEWKTNKNYWTMTPYNSSVVYVVYNGSMLAQGSMSMFGSVRPVINVYKSALETNNNVE